ncbi:cell adhesion molecule 3 isoform X2 [Bufo gargarizans]|uniref:cell adhesion molecule 3 isoform X2 n=1 Tax=Bufo gargarizans TaxID=30331 RepID=UPI001CF1CA5E|nr:cell adhesion molecule 3 isoform X2 [Bufo gargarizans]
MYLATILLLTLAGFTGANVSEYDPSQPVTSDVLVATGGKMTLTCTVDDHEESSLQWSNPAQQTLYFGEKRALRDNRIQLVKSSKNELSISISNVALSDEGEYTCSIFTMPVRTAKAMVTVLGVPQEPQISGYDRPIRENSNADLRCITSGSKPAANIRWYKGPEELEGARNSETRDPNGKTFTVVSLISFPVTKADDQAEITCTVGHESMPNTFKSSSQRLQVLYHPTAKIESRPNLPREGDRLMLQCDGYGNPEPKKYTWMRKNGDLPATVITDQNSLLFHNLNKSDSGTYICHVANLLGEYMAEYKLDVNDPSPVPSQSSIDHAVIGGVVAVIAFLLFCLLIVLGRYLIRHKGTYLTHEAKGSDDAPDADTAIINAEGGQGGSDDKKEYFI